VTIDLWLLVGSAVLCLAMPWVAVLGVFGASGGIAWGAGNREAAIELPAWTARARRAHANLVENLVPFAILVLTAHVAGSANAATALGAGIFFWGRVAHFLVYLFGIPYLRTAVFVVSLAGEILILRELIG
jgi:uncharacterized MAPEG superfamily protein